MPFKTLPLLAISLVLAVVPFKSFAEAPEGSQTGEILQEQDVSRTDSFASTQDKAIEYLKSVQRIVQDAATGSVPGTIPTPNENIISYLNAVYLYCTVNAGTCPTVLDTVLEIDVINSKISKQTQCPVSKLFWKFWVRNQMEQRQSFMVQTGFLTATDEFKKKIRPRYIKCDDTVKEQVQGNSPDAEFFKTRYAGESTIKKSVDRAVKLVEEIKVKVPNVFKAVKAG